METERLILDSIRESDKEEFFVLLYSFKRFRTTHA